MHKYIILAISLLLLYMQPVSANEIDTANNYKLDLTEIEEKIELLEANKLSQDQEKKLIQLKRDRVRIMNTIKAYNLANKTTTRSFQLLKLNPDAKLFFPASTTRITSYFDLNRVHPISGKVKPHIGIDIANPGDHNIFAAETGTVIATYSEFDGVMNGYGDAVMISHSIDLDGNGSKEQITTFYAHLKANSIQFKVGDQVKRGQLIAKMGNTGVSTGQHLHFEVHLGQYNKSNAIDPMLLLR